MTIVLSYVPTGILPRRHSQNLARSFVASADDNQLSFYATRITGRRFQIQKRYVLVYRNNFYLGIETEPARTGPYTIKTYMVLMATQT